MCGAVDRLKLFWAQSLLQVSVHAFVVSLDLPTEFQLVSIHKIQNRILLNTLLTREPGQTWKDDSDSLAKLLFCRKVIQSQSNKITSSSLHNELFQIKQNEVFLSARPWTISSMLQCFSVNYSVITSWLDHWLKQQNSQTLKSADGWKKISVWFLLLPRNCGGPHRVSRYYSIPWWLRTEPLTNRS